MPNKSRKKNPSRLRRRTGASRAAAKRRRQRTRGRNFIPNSSNALLDYIKSLHNPFEFRQVRLPGRLPIATQCSTMHGSVTFVTNAAGFARVHMRLFHGEIRVYNDATHTDTTIGGVSIAVSSPFSGSEMFRRTVAAAMKLRSTAAFAAEAGLVQAYQTALGENQAYDVYRDHPHQHIYSKGEVAKVSYIPYDIACFLLNPTNVSNVALTGGIGFLITGAPNQTYSLQYAFTYEYLSATNTDLVPARVPEFGDPHAVVAAISHNNPAKPDMWDMLKGRLSTAAAAGVDTLLATGNPFAAAGNALYAGVVGKSGSYYQPTSSMRPGNQQLMLTY